MSKLSLPVFWICVAASLQGRALAGDTNSVTLDTKQSGAVFEGIGALSAGASSRLLIDYPEPQRSEILDYLFKPMFGASLQHLKVEIGGDINSTDGTEPSIARTREEFVNPKPEYFKRGYEWWLMKEAKKRNPMIILDALQWGAPGWIGDGKFYSQDNADFIVAFIKGAKKYHDLDISYCGCWNEKPYNADWLKLLRKTLDTNGLNHVKIVASDQVDNWAIADEMAKDPILRDAIQVIGTHYPRHPTTPTALGIGKPLWSSEDGSVSGDWGSNGSYSWSRPLAQCYNRNYVVGGMTKTIIWSPIVSYFDVLPCSGCGLMRANEPWSGYYNVQPAIWITAHTTQFIQPGWKYLAGNACAMLPAGGSRVAAVSPNGKDLSVVIETFDAKAPQRLSFQLAGGLSIRKLHLWRSTEKEQFVKLEDVLVVGGAFSLDAEPGAIYSLTTTEGQHRGQSVPPPAAEFPLPYREDFKTCEAGKYAKYFSDQAGVFEVAQRADGRGRCLRQVVDRKGIEWQPMREPCTVLGSMGWTNYAVSVDARIEGRGTASLYGRVSSVAQDATPLAGYCFTVGEDGDWTLAGGATVLAKGRAVLDRQAWHALKLSMAGPEITASIDGTNLVTVVDCEHAAACRGLAAVGIAPSSTTSPSSLLRAPGSSIWPRVSRPGRRASGAVNTPPHAPSTATPIPAGMPPSARWQGSGWKSISAAPRASTSSAWGNSARGSPATGFKSPMRTRTPGVTWHLVTRTGGRDG